jgi:hypothetical protein
MGWIRGRRNGVDKPWFYGFTGCDGEPDFTGPRRFASAEDASHRWGVNYDTAGPFETRELAVAHLNAWIAKETGDR